MSSINDVAKLAKVSISTVSRVMNGHPNVRKEKREAVLKAVEELNYIPNALAQGLVKKSTHSVAILIADISNMFYANLLKNIENSLNKKGYQVLIGNTDWDVEKEKEYIRYMLQKQVDGIILTSTTLDDNYLNKIADNGVALVVLDRDFSSTNIDQIRVDDYQGAYMATEHLIKCGYEILIHILGPSGIVSAEDRKKAFLHCVRDNNLSEDSYKLLEGDFTEISGRKVIEEFLEQHEIRKRTGVFAANDAMALGILHYLKEEGFTCPEQIGIVGFDDISFARYSNPPLTTIRRPIGKIGDIAANIILERIEDRGKTNEYKRESLGIALIERQSTST